MKPILIGRHRLNKQRRAAAAARWHKGTDRRAGRLDLAGKQTDKHAPESSDTSQRLPSADWGGGGGGGG